MVKVLLPPATALMYEQLLKFENYELSKKTILSWERILEIRQLKDRMIRKCRKLIRTIPAVAQRPTVGDFVFQTFVAPPDFRVKAIEKWFREQQKRANAVARKPAPATRSISLGGPPCECSRCVKARSGALAGPSSGETHHPVVSSSKTQMQIQRSLTNPDPKQKNAVIPNSRLRMQLPSNRELGGPSSFISNNYTNIDNAEIRSMSSPQPLPVLIRGQRVELGLYVSDDPELAAQYEDALSDSEIEEETPPETPPSQAGALTRPGLSRRRSCIKRASLGDVAKTVSWADDQEWDQQFSKYTAAAREAQASGW